jgi:hypothetical protein
MIIGSQFFILDLTDQKNGWLEMKELLDSDKSSKFR